MGILAHSLRIGERRFAKGQVLDRTALAELADLGVTSVTVALLGPDDLDENSAAARLAEILAQDNIEITAPFAGRVNLIAQVSGVVRVDREQVNRLNQVDEAITFASLPDYARVQVGALIGTFKIIPYAVEKQSVVSAIAEFSQTMVQLHPFGAGKADLILTKTPGFKETLLQKGQAAIAARLHHLGWSLGDVQIVDHERDTVREALTHTSAEMVLILGASATSDRMDVAPAGLLDAGGTLLRFGMPVDPGNLLFLGVLNGRSVVGLPGCVRAPALNGADWVLERLAAKLPLSAGDIAGMGVGGLLKEIPQRTLPRQSRKPVQGGKIEVILLAAGKSRRMGADHKLLREIDGTALLRRSAMAALNSGASRVHVVLPPDAQAQKATLDGLAVHCVVAQDADHGLAASLRAGIAALSADCAGVIVALADMPDVTADHFDQLIAAFAPQNEQCICVPQAPNGKRGNPVLFDRRYFEALSSLQGDRGAKALIDQAGEYTVNVRLDAGVLVDLDTPEAWREWEQGRR